MQNGIFRFYAGKTSAYTIIVIHRTLKLVSAKIIRKFTLVIFMRFISVSEKIPFT
jgi:hypothetical protein